jgi:hypothetical protein
MEGRQMSIVIPETSPADLLARVRGPVKDARLTYPERVHFEVTDVHGGLWFLATWEAEYSPADPEELNGKTVVSADLDDRSRVLTIGFSDGTSFTVTPIPDDDDGAIENWELFTPDDLLLTYGPWGRWHLGKATDPY